MILTSCLLVVMLDLLSPSPAPAAATSAQASPATARDRVADRTYVAINRQRYRRARAFAAPAAVRELRRYRERGFEYFGRARNECYAVAQGSWQCPATVRKNGRLRGSAFLTVERAGAQSRWRVVEAFVVFGE